MSNERKKRDSDPKIKALGWEDLDPSELIDSAIKKFKLSAEKAKQLAQCSTHPELAHCSVHPETSRKAAR